MRDILLHLLYVLQGAMVYAVYDHCVLERRRDRRVMDAIDKMARDLRRLAN